MWAASEGGMSSATRTWGSASRIGAVSASLAAGKITQDSGTHVTDVPGAFPQHRVVFLAYVLTEAFNGSDGRLLNADQISAQNGVDIGQQRRIIQQHEVERHDLSMLLAEFGSQAFLHVFQLLA
jgi:hypothetical protein